MAVEEEDNGGGIPEWVVTFGDMMSLLLTFFIMLVSMSEIKEEEKYQAMVESFRQQFGYDSARDSVTPGDRRPRNSFLTKLATSGRAKRQDTMSGGDKVQAPIGDHPRVLALRPDGRSTVGTVLVFDERSVDVFDEHREALRQLLPQIAGKPQKIEVRGHASRRPFQAEEKFQDEWELSFQRARAVMHLLVDELGIEADRIRLSTAGSHEPYHIGTDPNKMKLNPRTEVFLLDEVVSELVGTRGERQQRYVTEE